MRSKLRRLALDGGTYLWGVAHEHDVLPRPPGPPTTEGRCRERFTAYLEGHKAAPVRIYFADGAGRSAGYPERGVVWVTAGASLNLNEPGVAVSLVRRALALGWQPATARRPFVIPDGFAVFLTD